MEVIAIVIMAVTVQMDFFAKSPPNDIGAQRDQHQPD
jgi:hypothetical protein